MPVMVQIRNMPDDMHRRLKEQAAAAGMSLSDYLLRETGHLAKRLSLEEMWSRLDALPVIETLEETALEMVHAGRREREQHLYELVSGQRATSAPKTTSKSAPGLKRKRRRSTR